MKDVKIVWIHCWLSLSEKLQQTIAAITGHEWSTRNQTGTVENRKKQKHCRSMSQCLADLSPRKILKVRPCGLPKPQKLYDNIIMVNKYLKPFCMSDTIVLVLITLMLFYSSPDFLFLVHINWSPFYTGACHMKSNSSIWDTS